MPVAAWCMVILWFSGETGEDSAQRSGWLLEWVLGRGAWLERWGIHRDLLHLGLRKGAHMFNYAVLGGLTANAFGRTTLLAGGKVLAAALGFCILFAGMDEWRQTFVPGRAGAFTDVLVDTAGTVLGILLLYGIRLVSGCRGEVLENALD
nr:VanZ family protein [Anaerotalea alkaliphila]